MKLISVEDELPVINLDVLVINNYNYVGAAYFDGEDWHLATTKEKLTEKGHPITHWIQL